MTALAVASQQLRSDTTSMFPHKVSTYRLLTSGKRQNASRRSALVTNSAENLEQGGRGRGQRSSGRGTGRGRGGSEKVSFYSS